MKKFWKEICNSESDDGTWDVTIFPEEKKVRLDYFNYENQGTEKEVLKDRIELILSYEQYQSLLDFSKRMNRKYKE